MGAGIALFTTLALGANIAFLAGFPFLTLGTAFALSAGIAFLATLTLIAGIAFLTALTALTALAFIAVLADQALIALHPSFALWTRNRPNFELFQILRIISEIVNLRAQSFSQFILGDNITCSAPGSLDTSLSHAAGLIEIAACHA